jgi:hypothetical protein
MLATRWGPAVARGGSIVERNRREDEATEEMSGAQPAGNKLRYSCKVCC